MAFGTAARGHPRTSFLGITGMGKDWQPRKEVTPRHHVNESWEHIMNHVNR